MKALPPELGLATALTTRAKARRDMAAGEARGKSRLLKKSSRAAGFHRGSGDRAIIQQGATRRQKRHLAFWSGILTFEGIPFAL
jgi:hypothetical protein